MLPQLRRGFVDRFEQGILVPGRRARRGEHGSIGGGHEAGGEHVTLSERCDFATHNGGDSVPERDLAGCSLGELLVRRPAHTREGVGDRVRLDQMQNRRLREVSPKRLRHGAAQYRVLRVELRQYDPGALL